MKKKSNLDKQFVKGGEIPHQGIVKDVMGKFDERKLRNQAGHTILNPKEAIMDAFNQACKSNKKLLNENGKTKIYQNDQAATIFRDM